jgi:hypothetical protein
MKIKMKKNLIINTFFIACLTTQLNGSMSSRADQAFLENADQFQTVDGIHVDDLYQYKGDLEVKAENYDQDSGPLTNKYLPPVVESSRERSSSKKKSFGFSFTDMAEKTQKTKKPTSFGFSFSSLADNIQKTSTKNIQKK